MKAGLMILAAILIVSCGLVSLVTFAYQAGQLLGYIANVLVWLVVTAPAWVSIVAGYAVYKRRRDRRQRNA